MNKFVLAFILSTVGLILLCAHSNVVDGGASGTDVGICKLFGEVTDSLGRPVAAASIRLRPFDYIAGKNDSSVIRRDVKSVVSGRFEIDSVPVGHYAIEGLSGDTTGQVLTCELDSTAKEAFLLPLILKPLAVIKGTMPITANSSTSPSVQVVGLEYSVPIDDKGNFSLKVPAGWCKLNLHGVDAERPDYDTLILLKTGQNIIAKPEPKPQPHICDSISCELAIMRELLDSMGLKTLLVDSVITIEGNRITGISLRNRGISVVPDPIGKFQKLVVLDLGNNNLKGIPRTIEFLRELRALRLDHNQLVALPTGIGRLDSLVVLDCSFNQLHSLPETITFISPSQVNFAENLLCNIGESTRKWLDTHEPAWKNNQDCQ